MQLASPVSDGDTSEGFAGKCSGGSNVGQTRGRHVTRPVVGLALRAHLRRFRNRSRDFCRRRSRQGWFFRATNARGWGAIAALGASWEVGFSRGNRKGADKQGGGSCTRSHAGWLANLRRRARVGGGRKSAGRSARSAIRRDPWSRCSPDWARRGSSAGGGCRGGGVSASRRDRWRGRALGPSGFGRATVVRERASSGERMKR